MDCKNAKAIWDKLSSIYEGDYKVKEAKLQIFRARFESLKMTEDEKIAYFFLRISQIVNSIRGLHETHGEKAIVKKALRSLMPKYDSKVSALEERDLNKLTIDEMHGVLTAYEMRISEDIQPSKETAFKTLKKDNDSYKEETSEDEDNRKLGKKKKIQNKKKTFFKKKSFYADVIDSCSGESLVGDETLFMAILSPNVTQEDTPFEHSESEIDLEGELKCALKEIKRLRKEYVTLKDQYQSANECMSGLTLQLAENKRILEVTQGKLSDKEKECLSLEEKVVFLQEKLKQSASNWNCSVPTNNVNDCKGKGIRQAAEGESLSNFAINKTAERTSKFLTHGFHFFGYCFNCQQYGHKENTCRVMSIRKSNFVNQSLYNFLSTIRCYHCKIMGHIATVCNSGAFQQVHKSIQLDKSRMIWKPKKKIEALVVQTALHSVKKNHWVVDNGCSHHMTGDKSKFVVFENYSQGSVRFGNDHCIPVIGKGTILLDNDTPLHDVYYLEGLAHNLLSLSQIRDNGFAGCLDDRKSISGGAFFLGERLVAWHSKKQNSVSLSTAEAEYIVAATCCTQVLRSACKIVGLGNARSGLVGSRYYVFPEMTCLYVQWFRILVA
ncbi:uncharacterized protein LOC131029369 [Cryptomeria japonica]|uniref:uncharacterized protein LOC131029369 n=1 Tax=Cryptomeria japonica TaxID=3369 RepID=UPI0025AD605E|nr:uncharacterized protein LOC131029369 [Cryptomeria japonica]